ncbi:hypothetical protein Pmar_PMAR027973, partial [Perkinsus marinus ATCC 50983]
LGPPMHNLVNIPLLVCLNMACPDLRVGRTEVLGPFPTADNNVDANLTSEGGEYEKPEGKCIIVNGLVVGCTCHTSNMLVYGNINAIYAAVCGDNCGGSNDCPKPPTGWAQCQPFSVCTIGCSNNEDCPGFCLDSGKQGKYCSFRT